MKNIFAFSLLIAAAFSSGCASGKNGLVLNPVGPVAAPPLKNPTTGTLTVYSAYEVNADFNSRDPNRPEYSDYKIFTEDGKLLQRVHNNSGTILQYPAQVQLPPGQYRVIARANGYGCVTIPVIIAAGESTTVHLENGININKNG